MPLYARASARTLYDIVADNPELARLYPQYAPATVPDRTAVDPLALPPMQQAALMFMHESHVSRAVYRRLMEDAQDRPSALDYYRLADVGLASKRPQDRFHRLSGEGAVAAAKLEPALCLRFHIHMLRETGGHNYTVRFRCPCGWTTEVDKTRNARLAAGRRYDRHLQEAKARGAVTAAEPAA